MSKNDKTDGHLTFSQEASLKANQKKLFDSFWQTGEFAHMTTSDGLTLEYCAFLNPLFSQTIVISPGRVEGYLKYQELVYDLFHQEYNVFVIDHRGQGLSQRMLSDVQKGYVDNFDDYAHDLHQFISEVVIPTSGFKPKILAHSMGGAIILRLLQLYPEDAAAAVLCSPMIAINTGAIPRPLALLLVWFMHATNKLCRKAPWYFFGQSDYQAKAFKDNHLMHSKTRYEKFIALYQRHKKLQLGGVTLKWLIEAEKARIGIHTDIEKMKTPFIIIQAGDDSIVDNTAQNNFCRKAHKLRPSSAIASKPICIKGALHELLFESDHIRSSALNSALAFFKAH